MATAERVVCFDENSHVYRDGSEIVPSVTQILTMVGLSTDPKTLPARAQVNFEAAGNLGTQVHLACEYLDRDELDEDSLNPLIVPYVLAYQKFRAEHKFKAGLIEARRIGEYQGLKFGMCVDRVGELEIEGRTLEYIFDIKTAQKPQVSWQIQTAAYGLGLTWEDLPRFALNLKRDGTYAIMPHNDENDYLVFKAALTIAHFRERNRQAVGA